RFALLGLVSARTPESRAPEVTLVWGSLLRAADILLDVPLEEGKAGHLQLPPDLRAPCGRAGGLRAPRPGAAGFPGRRPRGGPAGGGGGGPAATAPLRSTQEEEEQEEEEETRRLLPGTIP
ncbi:unnamed protein product, partial [Prorocentrum cordatum]